MKLWHLGVLFILSGAIASACAASAEDSAPLVLERTIPLGHVSGRIDHLAVDLSRRRLIVAELGNNTADVVDLATSKVVHRFKDLKEPQGVEYLPEWDLIVVANGGDGSVEFFNGNDFSTRSVIRLGDDADNVRRDPRNGHVIVGHGAGMLAVIDPAASITLSEIALAAHPEGFQVDPHGRVFANVPEAGQIAVVSLVSGKQVGTWTDFPGLTANFPMAITDTGSLLATVFRSPPRLVLLESGTGTVTSTNPTCEDADDLFFDSKRQRIYVSCGAGFIDAFEWQGTKAQHLARIGTARGARTSLFSPELDRLFVAARAGGASGAAILVFQPRP